MCLKRQPKGCCKEEPVRAVIYLVSDRSTKSKRQCDVTNDRKNAALSSDTSLAAGGIKLFESLRCVGS
jgi:hypothetical protein